MDGRINNLDMRVEKKIDGLDTKINGRLDSLVERMDAKFDKQEERFNTRFDNHQLQLLWEPPTSKTSLRSHFGSVSFHFGPQHFGWMSSQTSGDFPTGVKLTAKALAHDACWNLELCHVLAKEDNLVQWLHRVRWHPPTHLQPHCPRLQLCCPRLRLRYPRPRPSLLMVDHWARHSVCGLMRLVSWWLSIHSRRCDIY